MEKYFHRFICHELKIKFTYEVPIDRTGFY